MLSRLSSWSSPTPTGRGPQADQKGAYDPKRLFGVTTFDVFRALPVAPEIARSRASLSASASPSPVATPARPFYL
ncbi:unnamed protein product [Tilletia laevis]|uniref:Uncharacterized protein n=2 Tax=Tilletia TaxID=13289 RepID=A0A9N8M9X3_9BASI|nr:hypothetical protein CF336_g6516 [Tilletia laevis]CAD6891097.1 unnamed protein product [Tilletia caries]CAD6930197.1 unnamed protein product [Tilletia controversa]KAE8192472.1 hypothetical protein CF335_g5823 [Tilletia laevis]CAD6937316.1 unnamed protein product [Tilletia caries]